MNKFKYLLIASSSMLLLAACDEQPPETEAGPEEDVSLEEEQEAEDAWTDPEATSVIAEMYDSDSEIVGEAVFDESEEGVTMHLNLEDVPAGEYGMHIHEYGQATPPGFEDAGDHFDPTDADHGFEAEDGPHLGDLPNLTIPENGIVNETVEIPEVSLLPDEENTLAAEEGTSLIIHTEADDYISQPTGDAGERMIGGVIFAPQE